VVQRLKLHVCAVASAATFVVLLRAHPRPTADINAWTGEELTGAAAWVIATAMCAWLPVVALVYEAGLGFRRPRVTQVALRAAPPFARRIVELTIVGSSVVATAVPATAAPAPPAVLAFDEPVVRAPAAERPRATAPTSATTTTTTTSTTAPPSATSPTPAPTPRASRRDTPPRHARTHVVRAGDNLWAIARATLIARGVSAPADAAIVPYWRAVIAANTGTLRSGDPNLIYPGEIVTLPASS
jgi:nucleoid-associated protein YgaU